jgi:hypothetical protein
MTTPNNAQTTRTEIVLANDILDLAGQIASPDFYDRFKVRGIELLGVDIENVLTPGLSRNDNPDSDPRIAPWARSALETIGSSVDVVLLTNSRERDFTSRISGELNLVLFARGIRGLRGKTSPDMYQAAAQEFDVPTSKMGMVDDQFKNFRGAREAGLSTYFWVKPYGNIAHPGVKVAASLEALVVRPLVRAHHSASSFDR